MPKQLEYLNIERTQKFNAMKAIWRSFPFFFIFRSSFSTSLFLLLEIRKSREAGEGWQNRKYNLLLKEVCPNMINFFEDIYHKVGRFSWDANSSRKSINPNFHSKSLSFLLQTNFFASLENVVEGSTLQHLFCLWEIVFALKKQSCWHII